jgi:hypothetical protein
MACPVCDHTMQNLGVTGKRLFWCPRCGSLKEEIMEGSFVESPIWVRNIIDAAHVGGMPSISYHSNIPVRFIVESTPKTKLKVSLLEICT